MKDSSYRYIPTWPFPIYKFLPGVNPHPKKGGYMQGQEDPVASIIDLERPEENSFLRYALDLFNHGYFWESHVYFEALWNVHGRFGSVADFLKGMIKLGAAGVKMEIGQKQSALDHFLRARELFDLVKKSEGESFLGFDLLKINTSINDVLDSENKILQIHPHWK